MANNELQFRPDTQVVCPGHMRLCPDRGLGTHRLRIWFQLDVSVLQRYADRCAVDPITFLDDRTLRYVVVSVDPAGGGVQSQEAFVVWLVAGDRFALLTGRTASGHRPSIPFTTIPLSFVLALLRLLRDVRSLLLASFHAVGKVDMYGNQRTEPFVMPPVLVVMETNFAYGAAVYQQMLWLVDRNRRTDEALQDLDIIFATPVYMWDRSADERRREMANQREIIKTLEETLKDRIDRTISS